MKRFYFARMLVACLLLLLAGTLCAAAITPSYEVSATYRRSTYYQNLLDLPASGEGAFDTVAVALSQFGYHEGTSTSDLGGDATGNGNYTEYNYALGKVSGTYGYAWCAAFVSWCLTQSGQADSAGGLFASCTLWVERLQEIDRYATRASGYAPRTGDLIFFRSKGVTRASDHVGLVRYVTGGRVYTVEGNSSGQVSLRSYALGDSYIVGYGKPAYAGERTLSHLQGEDSAAGWYIVTYDFLNIRAAASASSARMGRFEQGEMFNVSAVEDGWGRTVLDGKTVYVSLEYADFVAPHRFAVRYMSEGNTLHSREYFSTVPHTVIAFTPEREGYEFLHWEVEGTPYTAGDALPMGDVTAVAVWRELPPVQEPEEPEGEAPDTQEPLPPVFGGESFDGEAPPAAPPEEYVPPVVQESGDAAARHAGVVSALLALCLGGVWLVQRKAE